MPITDIPLLLTSEIGRLILTFCFVHFKTNNDLKLICKDIEALNLRQTQTIATLNEKNEFLMKENDKFEKRILSLEAHRSKCPIYKKP